MPIKQKGAARVLLALCLSVFLYGTFFYCLVREQLFWMTQKQSTLESMKVLTVPGSSFLGNLGLMAPFYGSLFYLILLGTMFLVYQLLSLLMTSALKRAMFMSVGWTALAVTCIGDRIGFSFLWVVGLSFVSFYLLTLPRRIVFTPKEVLAFVILMAAVSLSLLYGSERKFFLKARDKVLYGTVLGNRIISFYYQYSPLAATLISMEQGIYQGVLFDGGINDGKTYYLGNGLFLAGDPRLKGIADFELIRASNQLLLAGRHGGKVAIASVAPSDVEKGIRELFSMKGLFLLTRLSLYFFPAGILLLLLIGIRRLTDSRRFFLAFLVLMGLFLIFFIWTVSLTGDKPPGKGQPGAVDVSKDGISLAYYLYQRNEVPESYVPAIRSMARSDSPVLRYWGAHLLGVRGNRDDADIVRGLLDDSSSNVRYTAAQALYRILKNESLSALLSRLISDPNWYVRCRVYSLFLEAGMIPSPA